jgi:uncharacterized RDD family membrane protein YckC
MGDDDFNPYQAPSADNDRPVRAGGSSSPLATRGSRLGAAILDAIIQGLVIVPLELALGVFEGFPSKMKPMSPEKTVLWGLTGFAVFLAFNIWLLAKDGQTIGKRLMKIRIVSHADGAILPISRLLLLRVLPIQGATLIPVIGGFLALLDVLLIFRADQRTLHDHLAGTVVVKA